MVAIKNVYRHQEWFPDVNAMFAKVKALGYRLFEWNGKIYEVESPDSFTFTGVSIDRLDDQ